MGQDRCVRPVYTDILNKAVQESNEAKKDNDFIYHEKIPDVKQLEPIAKAVIAKPTPLPSKFSSKFKGFFIIIIIYFVLCYFMLFFFRPI